MSILGLKLLVAVALVAQPLSAQADPVPRRFARWLVCEGALEAGCQRFLAGDLEGAVREFSALSAAQDGPWNMYAAYDLGYLFEIGAGVEKDPSRAVTYYDRAALQGIARAQHRLAFLLLTYCREAACRPPGHDLVSEASQLFEQSSRPLRSVLDESAASPGSYGEPHCVAAIAGSQTASQYPAALLSAATEASKRLTSSLEAYQAVRDELPSGVDSRKVLDDLYWLMVRHWLEAKSELCRCLGYEKTETPACDALASERELACSLDPLTGRQASDPYCGKLRFPRLGR